MEVFERLRLARKTLGLNQDELARSIGLKRGSYSDVERGKVESLSESTLMLLEINFGISRDWLLEGEGNMILTSGGEVPEVVRLQNLVEEQNTEILKLRGVISEIRHLCEKH